MDTLSSTLYGNNSTSAISKKCSMEAGFRGNVTRLKYITDEQLDLEACLLASENGGEERPCQNSMDKTRHTSLADLKSFADRKTTTKDNNLVGIATSNGDPIVGDNNCFRVAKNNNLIGTVKDNDDRVSKDNCYLITSDDNNYRTSEGSSYYRGSPRYDNYRTNIAKNHNFNCATKESACSANSVNNINFAAKDDIYRVTKDNDYLVGVAENIDCRITENNTYRAVEGDNYNYVANSDDNYRCRPKIEDERVNIEEDSRKYDERLSVSMERCQKLDDLNKVLDKIYIGEACRNNKPHAEITNFTDKNNFSYKSTTSNVRRDKINFEDDSLDNFAGSKKSIDQPSISNVDRSQKLADSRKILDRINVDDTCPNPTALYDAKSNQNRYRELNVPIRDNKGSNLQKHSVYHNAVKICPNNKENNFRKTVDLNCEKMCQARAVSETRNKSVEEKNIDPTRFSPEVNPSKTTQISNKVRNRCESELQIANKNQVGCCCRKMKIDFNLPCATSRHRGKSCCHPATKSVSDNNFSNALAIKDSAKMFFVERELGKFVTNKRDHGLVHQRSHSVDESFVGSEVPACLRSKVVTNNNGDNGNKSCRSLSAFVSSQYQSNSELNYTNKNANESLSGAELNTKIDNAIECAECTRNPPERTRSWVFSAKEDERLPVPSYRNRRDYTDSCANSSEETLLWRTHDTSSSSSNTSSVPSSLTESPDSPTPIPSWMFNRFIGKEEQHIRAISLPSQSVPSNEGAQDTNAQKPTRLFTSLRCRECVFCPDAQSNTNAVSRDASCVQVRGRRTYISTEAQTDSLPDYPELSFQNDVGSAGQQRREGERRPRRNRRPQQPSQINPTRRSTVPLFTIDPSFWTAAICEGFEMSPTSDEMDSHLPPPYSPMSPLEATPLPRLIHETTRYSTPSAFRTTMRMPTNESLGLTRCEDSGPRYAVEEEIKTCCGITLTRTISFRWMILALFAIGLVCAFFGTMMTAVRGAAGVGSKEHLTLSLLLIGVGLLLVTLSGLAWRLICSNSHWAEIMGATPTIESALPLSNNGSDVNRSRFLPRLPPSYGRPHHPYAAMLYPEFQYRPPPPSYQASMQEYRLRLLLMDRQQNGHPAPALPPPAYRTTQHQHESTFRPIIGFHGDANYYQGGRADFSRPPSYRSRSNSCRPPFRVATSVSSTRSRSRDRSQISLSESTAVPAAVDDFKLEPDEGTLEEVPPKKRESAENLVAIRQNQNTSDIDSSSTSDADITSEMDILAQL